MILEQIRECNNFATCLDSVGAGLLDTFIHIDLKSCVERGDLQAELVANRLKILSAVIPEGIGLDSVVAVLCKLCKSALKVLGSLISEREKLN